MINSITQKKILITGGSGFIGTHLCKLLLEQNHQVTIFDLVPSALEHPNLKFVRGDIRKPQDLKNHLTIENDFIFHFAAIVSVPECEQTPDKSFVTNFQGTQNVIDHVLSFKEEKVIPIFFASSAAVYGDLCKPGQQLKENDTLPPPLSFYGLHKFSAEQSLRLYCEKKGLRGFSFRFFNVFGPGQKADSPYSGVVTIFQNAFQSNQGVKLYNFGNNSRDFIHVSEIARACSLALSVPLEKMNGECINLCTGESVLIKDVFEQMASMHANKITVENLPARSGDIEFSCGNPTRAKSLLGFSANIQPVG